MTLAAPVARARIPLVVAALGVLGSCGGSSGPGGATNAVSTVAAGSLQIAATEGEVFPFPQGGKRQFRVATPGIVDTDVEWSIREGNEGGSITDAGLYTAPMRAGTFQIVAALRSDRSRRGTRDVTVGRITLSLWPPTTVLAPGGMRELRAQASLGAEQPAPIVWSVAEPSGGGSLDEPQYAFFGSFWASTSVFVAPDTPGTYRVIAQMRTDPAIRAEATMQVIERGFRPVAAADTGDARTAHTTTLLADGRILDAGGRICPPGVDPLDETCATATAALYDVGTRRFSPTGSLNEPRASHTATRLGDDRILITGGTGADENYLASAELYEPRNGAFMPTGPMNMPRWGHTASLLASGKVLITGGIDGQVGSRLTSAELYDPRTGLFALTGDMSVPRSRHSATLLANGKVLIVGGERNDVPAAAEIYDPATGTFVAVGTPARSRLGHRAARLSDGSVLFAGGLRQTAPQAPPNVIEIYRPETARFENVGVALQSSTGGAIVELADGSVLIAGGFWAEIFDRATGKSTEIGGTRYGRSVEGVVLPDGRVLFTGGGEGPAAAEIFE